MLKTVLVDKQTDRSALVDPGSAVLVQTRPIPPFGLPLDAVIFNGFLEDENGSRDMSVVASPAVPQVFSVKAVQGADLWVKGVQFVITGAGMVPHDFGGGLSLTDPCIFSYQTDTQIVILDEELTTNFSFLRLAGELNPPVGAGNLALLIESAITNQEDAYVPFIDFGKAYGFTQGLRLGADTEQQLQLLIQDDTTGALVFECKVFGYLRSPDTERA